MGITRTLATGLAALTMAPTFTVAAASAADNPTADPACSGTTWISGYRAYDGRFGSSGELEVVRPDEHTDSVSGDTACSETRSLLCAGPSTITQPLVGVVPQRYQRPWAGVRLRAINRVSGTELTRAAAADERCSARFGSSWRMATTAEGGTEGGFVAQSKRPRAWVAIDDQRSNPWDTVTGEALTWGVWKDYESDLVKATTVFGYTDPYGGDTPISRRKPILCIKPAGLPEPFLPRDDGFTRYPYDAWTGAHVDLTHPIAGTALTSRARADRLCRTNLGEGYRMAEFHDGKGWSFWGAGNITRSWVNNVAAPANPWD